MSVTQYMKMKKDVLRLYELGFDNSVPIYMNENLTHFLPYLPIKEETINISCFCES